MKNIREFLNKLYIGYKCRSVFITIHFNVENSKITHFFYEKAWIKSYFIQNQKIYIYLRYINNKPLFTKIGITFYKKNVGGSARILLHTSFGLLNLKIVENLSIGGEISYLLYE